MIIMALRPWTADDSWVALSYGIALIGTLAAMDQQEIVVAAYRLPLQCLFEISIPLLFPVSIPPPAS